MSSRARYTVGEIQNHALAIVDREGIDGLTMRALAASLGTGPMTLYNYVDGRTGLEELVVDAISAEVVIPKGTGHWERDVRGIATAMWQAVRAHPAAIPLVLTRRTSSAASFAPADALVDALASGGMAGKRLLVAFRTIIGYVMGIAQAELAGPLSGADGLDRVEAAQRIGALAATAHPNLAALARISVRSNPRGPIRERAVRYPARIEPLTNPPAADLERLLQLAAVDPAARPHFAKALLEAEVLVLGTIDPPAVDGVLRPGTKVDLFFLTDAGGRVLPFFTSEAMLQASRAAIASIPPNFVRMRCKDLWALTRGARLVLNPHGVSKGYPPDEIAAALDGTAHGATTHVVREEQQVRVGTPAHIPPRLVDVLSRFFDERPAARAAHLGWIAHADGHQGYILVVVTNDRDAAMAGFSDLRVAELTDRNTLDVMIAPADGAAHLLSAVQPFFSR